MKSRKRDDESEDCCYWLSRTRNNDDQYRRRKTARDVLLPRVLALVFLSCNHRQAMEWTRQLRYLSS